MNTVLLWLLLSVSDGSDNRGNVYKIDEFTKKEDCQEALGYLTPVSRHADIICIPAKVARPNNK